MVARSNESTSSDNKQNPASETPIRIEESVCRIRKLSLPTANDVAHEISPFKDQDLSTVHQICLQHSYPPSHLDRNHQGLRYLSYHGWDPDSRLGLGLSGKGIKAPV